MILNIVFLQRYSRGCLSALSTGKRSAGQKITVQIAISISDIRQNFDPSRVYTFELNGLEAPDEMPINTVRQQAPQQNSNKPRPTCHDCKKAGHYQIQCRQLKREKEQTRNNTNNANNTNGSAQTNLNLNNKVANNTKGNNINNQKDRRPRPVFPPCETSGRTNHSTEKTYLGANAANRPPPRNRRPEG